MSIIDRLISLFTKNKREKQAKPEGLQLNQSDDHIMADQSGQLIRKDEIGSIETRAIKLKASIETRKFTEEEITNNAKENQWYFEPAFWKVATSIQANKASLDTLLPDLLVAHTSGDPRREQQTVMQHLPEGTWRWPAYEDYVIKRDSDGVNEEIKEIKSADLHELLSSLKVTELRGLYNQYCDKKGKSSGKNKSDIIASITAFVVDARALTLTLRSRFIRELEDQLKPDYREICSAFAHKISMVAYGIRRRNQLLELANKYPMWKFIADDNHDIPKQCRKLNGKIFRHDDPF